MNCFFYLEKDRKKFTGSEICDTIVMLMSGLNDNLLNTTWREEL